MINAIRTGSSVIRYRGGSGQWAWAIHRVAGLGILAFLALHIVDIFVAAFGPALFNDLLFLYKGPIARFLEILLAFGLLYHALNGLRIIAADFVPSLASRRPARTLFYLQILVFLLLFVPASYFMMVSLPGEPFKNNSALALGVTIAILAIPVLVVSFSTLTPTAVNTRIDSNESIGNYQDGINRIIQSRQPRKMGRTEMNVWLFMRISGFLLIALALFHFFWLHFVISVEDITFNTIVQRWNDPITGWFWRGYDLALLVFAFTHGILGARYVIEDYVHNRGWKFFLLAGAALTWVALILLGAMIIFFFNGTLS